MDNLVALPCPFCGTGAPSIIRFWQREGLGTWVVHCVQCNTVGPDAVSPEEAVQKWDLRCTQY